jgi:hypothetical protein
MKTKAIWAFIIISLTFTSCKEEIDDTGKLYTTNTTTITGVILTEGGKVPVKGMKLNLDRIISDEFTYSHRSIHNFVTDSTGHFKVEFYATDSELSSNRSYNINYFDNNNKYITPLDKNRLCEIYLFHRRDTVINKTLLLPTRAYLRIKILENQKNIGFYSYYRIGDKNQSGGYKTLDETINEKIVEAAGNQINYIDITKRENNKNTTTTDSIFVTLSDTATYIIK